MLIDVHSQPPGDRVIFQDLPGMVLGNGKPGNLAEQIDMDGWEEVCGSNAIDRVLSNKINTLRTLCY